ncbi:extracellular solute-binding protein [candidate division KSB1 bacterium]|nr:extracellular solute-binding protein [candidate division KSB1 bacterium]
MVKRVCFLFLLFLFACNAGKRHESEISINVPANANLLVMLRNQLQQFEQRHQINVKLIPFTGQEKLYAMMAANQEPDVFYTNTVVRDQLAAEGRLLDLFTFVEGDSFIKKIRPEFIERGTSLDGGWYQFCDWTYTLGVYYNKSLFDLHRVPYPDSNWNWKGMLRRAEELTLDIDGDNKIDQYGIYIAEHFVSAIERMNGATYAPNTLLFSLNEASKEALQLYVDLMYEHRVMPEMALAQAQGMQLSQMLNANKVAMIVEALPNLDFITSLQVDWDVAPLPQIGTEPPRYFRSMSGGLSISSGCRYPQKAWELIKWLVLESPYNSPNPVLKNINFVESWQEKYPGLKNTHFGQVWRLSEKYDGGDIRDFVRYSSWSSATILETLAPQMDKLFANKISIEQIEKIEDDINKRVIDELKIMMSNENLRPAFREKIRNALNKISAIGS